MKNCFKKLENITIPSRAIKKFTCTWVKLRGILLININSSVMDVIPARSDRPYCLAICVLFDLILNILSQLLNDQGVTYIAVHQYTIQNHICELRDLRGKLGLFLDHMWTLVPIGTKSRNRDLFGSTATCVKVVSSCLNSDYCSTKD